MKKNLKKPVKPVNYITIPGKILQDISLSSTDKLVYGLCVSFINSTQNFKAGTHYISSVLGISRRVVFDSLSKLDRLNLLDITVVRSDGKNPVREISLPKTSFDQRGQLQFDDLMGLFNRVVKKWAQKLSSNRFKTTTWYFYLPNFKKLFYGKISQDWGVPHLVLMCGTYLAIFLNFLVELLIASCYAWIDKSGAKNALVFKNKVVQKMH